MNKNQRPNEEIDGEVARKYEMAQKRGQGVSLIFNSKAL